MGDDAPVCLGREYRNYIISYRIAAYHLICISVDHFEWTRSVNGAYDVVFLCCVT